jgi:hypothetical protein
MNQTYNTGKVQIGSAYNPHRPVYHDRDALKLQDALLGNKRPIDTSGVFIAVVCLVIAAIPVIHFWSQT